MEKLESVVAGALFTKAYKTKVDINPDFGFRPGMKSLIMKPIIMTDEVMNDFKEICQKANFKFKNKQLANQINELMAAYFKEVFYQMGETSVTKALDYMDKMQEFIAHDKKILNFQIQTAYMDYPINTRQVLTMLEMCLVNLEVGIKITEFICERKDKILCRAYNLISELQLNIAKTQKNAQIYRTENQKLAADIYSSKVMDYLVPGDTPIDNN